MDVTPDSAPYQNRSSVRATVFLLLLLTFGPLARPVLAALPNRSIQHAIASIEAGHYALAITYLDALVIDPRISARQRSRTYYFRGFSFSAQRLYVSAAQDYVRALEFDNSNLRALEALAELYASGQGVSKNPAHAFELSMRAARGGQASSMVRVGTALLNGTGTEINLKKARYWLSQAAANEQVGAMLYLALSYRVHSLQQAGLGDKPNPLMAQRWYQRAANKGSVDALVGLGFMYQNGELGTAESKRGEPQPDLQRALHYFSKAALQGSAVAQVQLAYMYLRGAGVEQNDNLAHNWFQRAANQEYAPAYLSLAYLYQSGRGVPRNPRQARQWFLKGARQGDVDCQIQLANDLLNDSVLASTRQAMHWFRAAAEQSSNTGANSLAWLLATTRYKELRNARQALQFAKQATANNPSSSFLDTLAAAYAEGENFDSAIKTQRQALARLDQQSAANRKSSALKVEFERHLAAYQQNNPWRE